MLKCQSTLMNTRGYNSDQGSLEEQEQEQCATRPLWFLLIDLNRFSAFVHT